MNAPVPDASPRTATLSTAEWQVVLNALSEIPWRIANPVLARLGPQLQHPGPAHETNEEPPL